MDGGSSLSGNINPTGVSYSFPNIYRSIVMHRHFSGGRIGIGTILAGAFGSNSDRFDATILPEQSGNGRFGIIGMDTVRNRFGTDITHRQNRFLFGYLELECAGGLIDGARYDLSANLNAFINILLLFRQELGQTQGVSGAGLNALPAQITESGQNYSANNDEFQGL